MKDAETIARKTCINCSTTKSILEFHKQTAAADGLNPWCKECASEWRRSYIGKASRKRYEQTESYKIKSKKTRAAYKANNPEKILTRDAVYRAVRRGTLVRKPCRDCGEVKVQAHHEDYLKRFEVIWLCPPCHTKLHRLANKQSAPRS